MSYDGRISKLMDEIEKVKSDIIRLRDALIKCADAGMLVAKDIQQIKLTLGISNEKH